MSFLSKEEFEHLAKANDDPSISIFVPLEREADKHDKNRIRLKNHLADAKDQLQSTYRMSDRGAGQILEPGVRLIAEGRLTADISDGLALYLSQEEASIYSLPISFEEQAIICSHFYLRPILPLFMEDGRFYILALSQNEIRLLKATAHSVHDVLLPDKLPNSLADALKWEDPEQRLQWHTETSNQMGMNRRAIFHGHGITNQETEKDDITEYFRQVADGVDELLKGQKAPMIVAGVQYLLPLYNKVSSYPHLLADSIFGNPEQISAQELHDRAWAIVKPHFEQSWREAANRFSVQKEAGLAVDDLEKVVAAAHFGQIETLFLEENGSPHWGIFDDQTGTIERHKGMGPRGYELLDRSAVYTILNGGTVYTLPQAEMPTANNAVAYLRAPVRV